MGTHRIRLLSSTLRVSLLARNSVSPSAAPADLTTPVFQFVSVEKLHKHSLHVAIRGGVCGWKGRRKGEGRSRK